MINKDLFHGLDHISPHAFLLFFVLLIEQQGSFISFPYTMFA